MPPQIKRLLLLFAIFIGLFLVARSLLMPKSFGEFGFYRGLSLQENAAVLPHYAGHESCTECHDSVVEQKETDLHATISCEACHGPCLDHNNNPDSVDVLKPATRAFCTHCHAKNPARNKDVITQIDPEKHNIGKNCIECHNPHMPWEMKIQESPEETSSEQQ